MKFLPTALSLLIASSAVAQNVNISGKLLNAASSKTQVSISYDEDFMVNKKSDLELTPEGYFKIAIDVNYPTLIRLRNDSAYIQAYVMPHHDLVINADIASAKTVKNSLSFGGDLAQVNQVLFDVQYRSELATKSVNTGMKIPVEDLILKINEYYQLKHNLVSSKRRKSVISSDASEILRIDSLGDEYNKALMILNIISNRRLKGADATQIASKNIDPSLFKQPTANDLAISQLSSFWDYSYLMYLNDRDFERNPDFYKGRGLYTRALDRIDTLYKKPLKDHATASILANILYTPDKIWPFTADSLTTYANSFLTHAELPLKTKALLRELVATIPARIFASKKGTIAPGILAADVNGNRVSLEQFKDKLILVDIWASWCAPCIAQLPYWNKLITQFKNKDIEFIMLSIDEKENDWKKALKSHPSPALQLHIPGGYKSEFAKAYQVMGIPRYLLIKNSKIINYDAPPPSVEDLVKELNQLLN